MGSLKKLTLKKSIEAIKHFDGKGQLREQISIEMKYFKVQNINNGTSTCQNCEDMLPTTSAQTFDQTNDTLVRLNFV